MILIGTPSRDLVNATFTFDMVQLVRNSKDVYFVTAFGTYLQNLRTELVNVALQSKASHILFVDSDMRFPPNALNRLLNHNLDFIAANYRQRMKDQWTACQGEEFINSVHKSGLQEVDVVGFGLTLIKTSVFEKVPQPWFAMPFDGNKFVGEDVFFCHQAKGVGFEIFIDHDLSQEIKHTGSKEY